MKILVVATIAISILSIISAEEIKSRCAYQMRKYPLVYNFTKCDQDEQGYIVRISDIDGAPDAKIQFKMCGTFDQFITGKNIRAFITPQELKVDVAAYIDDVVPEYQFINNKNTFEGIRISYQIQKPVPIILPGIEKLEIDLICDTLQKDNFLHDISASQIKDTNIIRVLAKSRRGCPILEHSTFTYYMQKFKYVFAIIFMIVGIFFCFFGIKLVPVTVFLTGFITIFLVAIIISFSLIGSSLTATVAWVLLLVAFLLGAAIGYALTKFIPVAFVILGALCGVACAFGLNSFIVARIVVGPANLLLSLLIVALGIVGGYLGYKFKDQILIISTSINGSYLIIKGIGMLIGNLPAEDEIATKLQNNDPSISTGVLLGYVAGWIVLSIIGMAIQCKTHKKEEDPLSQHNDYYSKA